jgi:hypothetical protein
MQLLLEKTKQMIALKKIIPLNHQRETSQAESQEVVHKIRGEEKGSEDDLMNSEMTIKGDVH